MSKKKRKKHIIAPMPKGPQSDQFLKRQKKVRFRFGLNDEALVDLGYRFPLSTFHKVLFVISICTAMLPFWFLLEKKRFATRKVPAILAFVANLALWIGLAVGGYYLFS